MADNNAEQISLDDLSEISAGSKAFEKNADESDADHKLTKTVAALREGALRAQTTEMVRNHLPNIKHQFKSLCAFGGVAPNLIIQDGQFSPVGLAENIGETAAISIVGEVPFAGPIISGVLSVYFSSLQSNGNVERDKALLEKINKMMNLKSNMTLSNHDFLVTEAVFDNITTKSLDYHNNLLNYCGFALYYEMDLDTFKAHLNKDDGSQPLITINDVQALELQGQVRQLETMVFELDTHIRSSVPDVSANNIIYLSAYRNLGLFATGCAMQISSYIALLDILEYCMSNKSEFDAQKHHGIVSDNAQQFIVDSHNKLVEINGQLARAGSFRWNNVHPGLSVYTKKGGDLFTTMVRLFLARYKGLYTGQRQSSELFTMLSRSDADRNNVIFAGEQQAWLERNAPPTSVRGVYHKAFIERFTFSYQPVFYNDIQEKTAQDCAEFNYKLEIPAETQIIIENLHREKLTSPPSYIAASSKFAIFAEAVEHYTFTVLDTGCCHLSLSGTTLLFDIGEYGRFTQASRPNNLEIFWDNIVGNSYNLVNKVVKENQIVNFSVAGDKDTFSETFDGVGAYFIAGSVTINGISQTQYPQDNTFSLIIRNINSRDNIAHAVTNLAFKKRLLEFDACCSFTGTGQENIFLNEYHHSDPFIGRKIIGVAAGRSLAFLPHQLHERDINREWDIFLVIGFYNILNYPGFSVNIYDNKNDTLRSKIDCQTCSETSLSFDGFFVHQDDMEKKGSNPNKTQFIIYRSKSTVTLPDNIFRVELVCNDQQIKYMVASLCFSRELDELDKELALNVPHKNLLDSISPAPSFAFTTGEQS